VTYRLVDLLADLNVGLNPLPLQVSMQTLPGFLWVGAGFVAMGACVNLATNHA
jgi:hypothetical protein